jgi:hypothetical protein
MDPRTEATIKALIGDWDRITRQFGRAVGNNATGSTAAPPIQPGPTTGTAGGTPPPPPRP